MTIDSKTQVFRYPHLKVPWLELPFEWLVAIMFLCFIGQLYLKISADYDVVYNWPMFMGPFNTGLYTALMYWYVRHMKKWANGHIELNDTALTRYFGDGSSMTLAWNDVIYSVGRTPLQHSKRLNLTSEAGKKGFYIPDKVENFSELQDIIASRATQHHKDVKRGQISVS